MKLIPKAIAKDLPAIYSQEENKEVEAKLKFFHPMSSYTFYLLEYDSSGLCFGLVVGVGDGPELGYVHLTELETVRVMGLGIERDLCYKPEKLSVIKKRYEEQGC